MKLSRIFPRFIFSIIVMTAAATAADKPHIVILATGGTIAGAAESQTQAGYTSGQVGVDILLDAVPQIRELATISGEQVANVGSQDMSDAIWLTLARRVNALLAQPEVDGIVITHGTDTIEETAYFLNLVVNSSKPVVMTAAMRPSTALSAAGPLNIYNAVAVAADKNAAVANGAKDIVTAGVGNGNMTGAALQALAAAVPKGVVAVRATRVPGGSVGRNVEVNDDELGTVVAGELSPAKARVLLKLALLKTSDPEKIQQLFDRY